MDHEETNHNGVDVDDEEVELDDADEIIDIAGAQHNGEEEISNAMEDLDAADNDEDHAPYPERDDAQTVFQKHSGSVFCVSINSQNGNLAVTGGEDDRAFVWKIDCGEIIFECTGHKDSVTCASFSNDGLFVATGDMSGLIKVWQLSDHSEVWSFEVADLEWLQWHQAAHVLVAGCADGNVWMWKIPSGDCKTMASHGASATVGCVMHDGKRLCVGYDDGCVKIWDLRTATPVHTFSGYNGHNAAVTCVDCNGDNSLVITGSTDGTAKLFSVTAGKALATFVATKLESGEEDSFEAVSFSPTMNLVATGTLNGVVNLWDISSHVLRHSCKHETGIVRLKWDASKPVFYSSTLDGAVSMWDARSGQLIRQWLGHVQEILDMDVSRDGHTIVTASGDSTARVFTNSQ